MRLKGREGRERQVAYFKSLVGLELPLAIDRSHPLPSFQEINNQELNLYYLRAYGLPDGPRRGRSAKVNFLDTGRWPTPLKTNELSLVPLGSRPPFAECEKLKERIKIW